MLVKRETKTGNNNLNVVYRPCTVNEIIGNNASKKILKNALDSGKLSHTLLFSGPAGCGKTTAARIVALGLNCSNSEGPTASPCLQCNSCKSILEGYNIDVQEINVGKEGGKSDVANVVDSLASAPFNSRYKVIIFDEAHELTTAAKDLLLKEMEDGYSHVYFIFCTNQPDALKSKKKGGDAFLTRCTKLAFNSLSEEEIDGMLKNVLEFEGEDYNEEVISYIITETKGVPRDALTALNNVIHEGSWSIEAAKNVLGVLIDEEDPQIIELSRTLSQGTWKKSCSIYEKLSKTVSTEGIRLATGGYFLACLKKSSTIKEARRFSQIMDILSTPIYVTGKPADQLFYNMMFKIVDLITVEKGGK